MSDDDISISGTSSEDIETFDDILKTTDTIDTSKVIEELEIKSIDDLFKIICVAKGIDPNQIQAMSKFSNMDNNDERSYYPNQLTTLAVAQLRMYGKSLYPKDDWNEYTLIADLLSVGYMGFKGFKSGQFVDITSGQPNLDKLRDIPQEIQTGLLSSLFRRNKSE